MNKKQQERLENVMAMLPDGSLSQLARGLTFGEAYSMVVDYRSLRDGNYYWIGTLKNHLKQL